MADLPGKDQRGRQLYSDRTGVSRFRGAGIKGRISIRTDRVFSPPDFWHTDAAVSARFVLEFLDLKDELFREQALIFYLEPPA